MNSFLVTCGLRKCTKCGEVKSEEDDFSFRDKSTRTRVAVCRACVNTASQKWYQNNKERCAARARIPGSSARKWKTKKRDQNKILLVQLKSVPCFDCKVSYPPWVMQFDHRDAQLKKDNLATMAHNGKPTEAILEEASKCDVVCANCHMERTHRRRSE